ncbi:glycosyltransferase [Planococcus liqunii]|uniref:glycosyltransferase n=1 Tax=Planococcus liqunii TaxID=3058394 RepID=UPI00261442FF|nr:glycosyltransferase [Planococcus sp. N056]WKA50218.1 glycosyltransferase [Planococcus sp. N056]
MNKKTIIYIGAFELPDKDAAAHRVLNNAKIFKKLGYNVVFSDVNRSKSISLDLNKKRIIKGFEVWSREFPTTSKKWLHYLISINEIKKIIKEYSNVDIIIAYNYQSFALFNLLNFCKKNNIKLISDCTEWYEDKRAIKKLDTTFRMRYLHKRIDGIICISDYLRDYYKKYVKTIVIPPLIDAEEEKWEKTDSNNQEIIKFIYSGNPGKHKDKLNLVIEAFHTIQKDKKNFNFTIVGLEEEEYLQYYPEHKELLDTVRKNVIFVGRVNHSKSLEYVKKSDFQIFIRENKRVNNAGFPTKFVESMGCRTPVITTNTSDLAKYLIPNVNGFFVEEDAEISKILKKIINLSFQEINKMKRNCNAIENFDFHEFIVPTHEFLSYINEKR